MFQKYILYAGIALLSWSMWIPAAQAEEEASLEHGKINTADASPVDPGHFEIEFSSAFTHAHRFWDADGNQQGRGSARENALGLSPTTGVLADLDIAVSSGLYMAV